MNADDEDDEEAKQLAALAERLRTSRVELARTIRALREQRRTPAQIRALTDRARRLVYKSVLIRRRIDQRWRVH